MPARRTRLLALAALPLAATGCGSEVAQEAAERSSNPVVAAAGTTAEEGSARLALSVQAGDQVVEGEGLTDLREGDRASMTMRLPSGPAGEVEMRAVDGEVFLRVPGLEQRQPGKRWVRVDPEASGANSAGSFGIQDPADFVQLVESAADFEETGTGTVRGDEVTTYEGTIDLAELADGQRAGEQLKELGLEEVPAEVAVDGEDRLRRITYTIDLASVVEATGRTIPEGAPSQIATTVELFDFGVEVDVEAPPAAEVVEASEVGVLQQQPA